MIDIGQRLKDLRKAKGLTQQQVADRVWVTKAMSFRQEHRHMRCLLNCQSFLGLQQIFYSVLRVAVP